jgi:peptidoglycan/LPS O-acetylase OafA/YrhL
MPKLGTLEVGRFIAALVVVMSHAPWFLGALAKPGTPPLFGGWVAPGPFAVQYFFTLSGFVMILAHHQDFGRPLAPLRFWAKRAARIFPMYWLALALALLCGALPADGWTRLYLFSLAPVYGPEMVQPAWSLHVEMAFYVIFGLCLLPFIGRAILVLWLILAGLACYLTVPFILHTPGILNAHATLLLFGTTFCYFHLQFFSGLLAGWLFLKFRLQRVTALVLLGMGVATLAACLPALGWGQLYFTPPLAPVIALGFGALMAGLAGLERAGALSVGRWAGRLGAASYPLYILHFPLLQLFSRQLGSPFALGLPELYVVFGLECLGLVLLAYLAAVLLDQPLQRLLRHVSP